jgi:cell division protein ZapD
VILYEHPFNERIRTYLRLERLFARLNELAGGESALSHHHALTTLFEVLDVAARADLKSDVLKDLDKQKALLNSYRGNPAIDTQALDGITAQVETCFRSLNALVGKAGQALADNEWLMSVRSRAGIPGGTCEFDLPSYHAWQHRSPQERREHLAQWVGTLKPLTESIELLLRLLRDSGRNTRVMAVGGHFQQALPQNKTCQLLRLRISPHANLVPEISGNRLMVSVRLMKLDEQLRAQTFTGEMALDLAFCS